MSVVVRFQHWVRRVREINRMARDLRLQADPASAAGAPGAPTDGATTDGPTAAESPSTEPATEHPAEETPAGLSSLPEPAPTEEHHQEDEGQRIDSGLGLLLGERHRSLVGDRVPRPERGELEPVHDVNLRGESDDERRASVPGPYDAWGNDVGLSGDAFEERFS